MPYSRWKVLVRLVAAALLLVLQLSPPALRHSHALAEDSPHRHGPTLVGHSHCHSHGHSHGHAHHRGWRQAAGHSHSAIANATPHVHVQLLAFRFTLPLGNSPSDGDDRDFGDEAEFVIAGGFSPLFGECLAVEREASPAVAAKAAMSPALFCDVADGGALRRALSAAPPRPLCDAARHERSGVQLI